MMKKKKVFPFLDIIGILVAVTVFGIPFAFMFVNAIKERTEANLLNLSWPKEVHLENFVGAFQASDYQIITAFKNSSIIVVGSVALLVIVGSMGGYVLQRRKDKTSKFFNALIMVGLMVPASILPTIWVLQILGIYKTIYAMVLIEVALQIPFTIMLYRGFMSGIPKELEEAGYIDGCTPAKIFSSIILPLLKPVTSTVIILNAVTIFNDFTNPLYFLPGKKFATVQLTLYNFIGQYSSSYNLLFANVIIITIPMLILFIFFNKKIVDGMVAGAVKG